MTLRLKWRKNFCSMAVQFTHVEAFASKDHARALRPGNSRRRQVGSPGAQSARWRHLPVTSRWRLRTCRLCGRMPRLRVRGRLRRRRWRVGGVRRDGDRGRYAGGRRDPETATAATATGSTAVLRRRLLVCTAFVHIRTHAPEVYRRRAAVSDTAATAAAAAADVRSKPGAGAGRAGVLRSGDDQLTRRNSTCRREVCDDYDVVW